MKRFVIWISIVILLWSTIYRTAQAEGSDVAEETTTENNIVVVLGANLSDSEQETVLDYLGITEIDTTNITTINITEEDLQEYDSENIETQALLGISLKKLSEGDGIQVNTDNLQNISSSELKNAFLTLGITDTEVSITAPYSMDGETAFWYVVKGYEELTGEDLSEEAKTAAWDEIVTEQELSSELDSSERIETLIKNLKAELANGDITSEEDMRKAIQEEEKELNMDLSDEQIDQIVSLLKSMQKVGLTIGTLVTQAQDMYAEYGTDMIDHPDQVISSYIKEKISDYIDKVLQQIENQVETTWDNVVDSFKQKLER